MIVAGVPLYIIPVGSAILLFVNLIYVANVPQSPWTKARPCFPEIPKKFEFLAHKTVTEKKNPKNCELFNTPTSDSSTAQNDYIGKKREVKEKYNEEKRLIKIHQVIRHYIVLIVGGSFQKECL